MPARDPGDDQNEVGLEVTISKETQDCGDTRRGKPCASATPRFMTVTGWLGFLIVTGSLLPMCACLGKVIASRKFTLHITSSSACACPSLHAMQPQLLVAYKARPYLATDHAMLTAQLNCQHATVFRQQYCLPGSVSSMPKATSSAFIVGPQQPATPSPGHACFEVQSFSSGL